MHWGIVTIVVSYYQYPGTEFQMIFQVIHFLNLKMVQVLRMQFILTAMTQMCLGIGATAGRLKIDEGWGGRSGNTQSVIV